MKTILLTSLITLISIPGFSSVINLLLPHQASWTVVINNHTYHTFGNSITIQGLRSGENFIQIVRNHGPHRNVVFYGSRFIPYSSTIDARLDPFGNLTTRVYSSNLVMAPSLPDHPPVCHNTPAQVNAPGFSIEDLIRSVRNTPFDESRLMIMKQAIRSNGIYSEEVLMLMNELSFESSKLDLAKFSSHFVSDINRYYIVNNGFTFSSSVTQLNQYLNRSFG